LKVNSWKTIDSKVSHTSHAWGTICTNFYNVLHSNGFDVSNHCITFVMGIFLLPNYVNGTYEYIAIWTSKPYVQWWTSCNVVPTIRTNGCSIFVNRILHLLGYLFGHIDLGLFKNNYVWSMIWWGFVVDLRLEGCFHSF